MLRIAKWSPALCLLIVLCGSAAHAQTVINAASCNESDVSKALGKVGSGSYIVAIPSGTCEWTSQLSYTVPSGVTSLTIQGNTAVNCTGTAGTSSYACSDVANTVIVDSTNSSSTTLLTFTTGAASTYFRLTGITFQAGSRTNHNSNGFMILKGASQNLRVDHNDFNTLTGNCSDCLGGLTILSTMNGVFDHNTFELIEQENGIRYYPETYGNTAWSQPTGWGTSNFIFLENNVFAGGFANDCDNGGRMVVRYNTYGAVNDTSGDSGAIQTHSVGQGVAAPRRGCRTIERYHNYGHITGGSGSEYTAGDNNSGTGLAWGNTIGAGYNYDIALQISGRELSGNNCGAGAGKASGCPAPSNGFGYCGNGSSGVTSAWDGNTITATGYPCLGQVGRGQGDLLNGANFPNVLNTVTGTEAWPHEMLEPLYVWNETVASGNIVALQTWNGVTTVANRDFYSQVSASANTSPTSPFNGTTGTGFGTLANRPTTCTAGPGGTYGQSPTGSYGVAYFATEANGGQGELYVCTATNTWTPIYEPYTYPHPLTTGGSTGNNSGAPVPPIDLSATVQ
jgi:hypothetical protein